ncbi:MAG: sulfatase-like hydrolase/transferase [Planctomycetales bacterium]|nr:sulfatase-like hydrolase/transferase [Planctomycetales bacterium]
MLVVCWAAATATAADRPNIVFILADDVGCDAIGCYGGQSYATPNVDAIAADGLKFTHCYSMPSCHPTRMTLLTGRYPRRLGGPRWGSFPADEEPRTIARVLKNAGYATAVAGKWQLALLRDDLAQPFRLGFDQYSVFGWHEGARYYDPFIYENAGRRDDTAGKYGPDLYSDFLIDFMRANRRRRFFAYLPMALCHDVTDDLDEPVAYGPRGRYDNFAEMMVEMDRIVGKVTTAIAELGLAENTLLVFTGDNGTAMRSIVRVEDGKYIREPVFSVYNGRRVQGGKTLLTDGGTHVPLLVRWPGVTRPGEVVDDLIDFSDFLPTFAELAGAELPTGVTLDGHSFARRLTRDEPSMRRWAYAERGEHFWVRTGDWKLYDDGRLFHMADDADEQKPIDPTKLDGAAADEYTVLQAAVEQARTLP